MKVKFQWLFLLLLLCFTVQGNNVKVGGSPVLELGGDNSTISINCTLSWENSWRDEFNWDAVWVFVKYKKEGTTGAWSHLNLGANPVIPSGFTFDLGKTGAKNTGLFVFRDSKSGGPVNGINITLKTTLSELGGITADDIRNGKVYAAVSALEMVYIPYGAYYLGDGASNSTFSDADGNPVILDNEAVRTVYTKTNGSVSSASVNANYPKGYRGFYCLKYELSQEQYVSFLNMLSYDQQKARIGNPLDNLQKGDYVFGDKTRPSARNGIAVFTKQSGKPALFANNLNPAEPYYAKDDGQTIACNYLTPEDMLAYCDWCGLRPMSEMEYEKACRRPYPQAPAAKEYAWNQTTYAAIQGTGDMTGLNTEDESPASPAKNVNVSNASFGPARCGSFGSVSSTQSQAGATFWGIMEMSGNTGELCYGIKATGFNASDATVSHGDGTLNANGTANVSTSYWPVGTTAGNFAVRGGSFASADTNLRVSDRTILSVSTVRDSSVGFRAVRTFGGGSVTLSGGAIVAENNMATDTACPGVNFTVKSQQDAQLTGISDVPVSYIWYLDNVVIPGQSGSELNYTFDNTTSALKTFTVTRKAVCAVGETMANAGVSIRVPNTRVNQSLQQVALSAGNNTQAVTLTSQQKGVVPVYTWVYGGQKIPGDATYIADQKYFEGASGDILVTCVADIMNCLSEVELTVIVEKEFSCGQRITDERDGSVYGTVKITGADGFKAQCWFQQSLNIGTYVAAPTSGNYWNFTTAGIQKNCLNNIPANCDLYGALYQWWEALCNGKCSTKLTTSNALTVTPKDESELAAYGAKMVQGSTTMVQGICPDGWHIPSDEESKRLEMNLGMSRAEADKVSYRGTDEGTRIKLPGDFCSGELCNASGFGLELNGSVVYYSNQGTFYTDRSGFWTSTPFAAMYAWNRWVTTSNSQISRDEDGITRSWGVAVRCLKD